jgi:uncharacterized protein (TIGR02266 family)
MSDRREHPRYPVTLEVSCTSRQRTMKIQSKDLSLGGVFLHTVTPEPVRTEVSLVIHGMAQEIQVQGQVVHSIKGVGMGVQFETFTDGGQALLGQLIAGLVNPPEDEPPLAAVAPRRPTTSRGEPAIQPDDRRAHRRSVLQTEVHLESHSNFYTGFTQDISEGGLFVASDNLLPMGTMVELQFSIADGKPPIAARGEVRWTRMHGAGTRDDAPAGMGLRFVMLTDDDKRRIEAFVVQRDTLFFED